MPPKKKKAIPKIEKEDDITRFAELIQNQLALEKPDGVMICITQFTCVEIDEIKVDIYVQKENNLYSYEINSVYSLVDNSDDDDINLILLQKDNFATVLDLLVDIEDVKKTYRFVEHKLLPPNKFEFAKLQRVFFTLSPDKLCSICYVPTIQHTICNHPICFKCREKCVKNNNKLCPICREKKVNVFPSRLNWIEVI